MKATSHSIFLVRESLCTAKHKAVFKGLVDHACLVEFAVETHSFCSEPVVMAKVTWLPNCNTEQKWDDGWLRGIAYAVGQLV